MSGIAPSVASRATAMRRLAVLVALLSAGGAPAAPFRAGAAAVDVTPEKFPVVVNCSFAENTGKAAQDRLHARALVFDDGATRLAVVVVDSCMMPREFLDRAKDLIARETSIPADRQLISATHTHSAPAAMGCLGSDPDPVYGEFLQRQLVQAVRQANANLAPAKVGWAVADAGAYTNCRQWVLRSDKVRTDPFGAKTVRSNMHPGYQNPEFVGPSGPADPWLSVLSVQTVDGRPLAALANFSMHYFGAPAVSADYFGKFCAKLETKVAASGGKAGFVAVMSQGTAGDLHWMDYGRAKSDLTIETYSDALAGIAFDALQGAKYDDTPTLAMAETKITLGRRTPDAARLAWAKPLVEKLGGRKPTAQPDIYAREAVFLHDEPKRELKLQAVRIGAAGITAMPNEVFALTGLKVKAASPLPATFNIELANGADGYIPPPEQHVLGGYTTWPARTAGLEVGAEPRIADEVLSLLEKVSGKPRRPLPDPAADAYAKAVLADRPVAYWRLGETAGPIAKDLLGKNDGRYESGVVFGLPGPVARPFDGQRLTNRAAHFAGGRMVADVPKLGDAYSVELWLWNGFPADVRDTTGHLFAFAAGDNVGDGLWIGRTGELEAGAVARDRFRPVGRPAVPPRTWTHVLFVRDGGRVRAYRNGNPAVEMDNDLPQAVKGTRLYVGGRADGAAGFEGRIAEVAVYDRALTAKEASAHATAAK